jgi:hypothetical protein
VAEQGTFNPPVVGSNPTGPSTKLITGCRPLAGIGTLGCSRSCSQHQPSPVRSASIRSAASRWSSAMTWLCVFIVSANLRMAKRFHDDADGRLLRASGSRMHVGVLLSVSARLTCSVLVGRNARPVPPSEHRALGPIAADRHRTPLTGAARRGIPENPSTRIRTRVEAPPRTVGYGRRGVREDPCIRRTVAALSRRQVPGFLLDSENHGDLGEPTC